MDRPDLPAGGGQRAVGWIEPATGIALRFGAYRGRYVASIVLLLVGGVLIQFTSAYTLPLLVGGMLASIAGWVVVPARGWRRIVAVGPGLLGVASVLNGAQSGALVALTLASWLLVRMRPMRSYPVVVIPVATAYLVATIFPQYPGRALLTAVLVVAVVASAWIARSLAALNDRRVRADLPART